jgi:hypothetical protein
MQEEVLYEDPEEETEKKLVNGMALGVVAIVVGGVLILALRPWIKRFREQHTETEAAAGETGGTME